MPVTYATTETAERPQRPVGIAMLRGARGKCPSCGKGRLFRRYLKVVDHCRWCGTALHHHRADDAPAYFTIFAVGHIVVPLLVVVERVLRPELWVHAAIWLPLTLVLSLILLPIIKGALVSLQWALYMHGFDPAGDPLDPHIDPGWQRGSTP
jgi:uncharacterized protein (DUF983 family)